MPRRQWHSLTYQVTATVPISIVVPLCAGDFSEDGIVSTADVQTIAARWDQTAGSPYDLDGDGRVTVVDVMRVTRTWGTCP
ncbi:MAG: dockerin type I domain-containing protein [Anaerolineae bacterium]